MTTYTVRHYDSGLAGHLYVIQQTEADTSELDRTLLDLHGSTCDSEQHAKCLRYNNTCGRRECRRRELVADVFTVLQRAIKDTGFDTGFFRPPKNYTLPTRALDRGPLRVYGLRYDRSLFVAGPAVLKLEKAIQDEPWVAKPYFLVERARVVLRERLGALPGCTRDANGNLQPPRDEEGRCYLPDEVLHPF